ncbi:MAG: carbon-nitrogen hydrolase family protein [Ktedonobacterales bacterium]
MNDITIALLQMTAHGTDQDANLAKGEAFCRRAWQMGADIALFPEMWNVGYTFESPKKENAGDLWRAPELWKPDDDPYPPDVQEAVQQWQKCAIGRESRFVTHFQALAKELDMAIALTYLEEWDGPPRNSVSLVDRHGEIVLTYAKVHTCAFDLPEAACTPGDDFYVCTLDTAHGAVAVGAMICYDREFPESARVLMLKGAEIILTPNACEMESNRLNQFRTRAYENAVGVALANYAGPRLGHSVAYDPIAFGSGGVSRDTLLVEAGEQEDIYLARFDLDALRSWRTRETWGNAFRRPSSYSSLTSPDVQAPFIRVNVNGERYRATT